MRRSFIATVIASMVALTCALVGCGGFGSGADAFTGLWALESAVEDGQALTAEQVSVAQALGCYLTLESGGKATLEAAGASYAGTWKVSGNAAGSLTLEGGEAGGFASAQTLGLEGGKLTMSAGDDAMSFRKIDESEKRVADLGALATTPQQEQENAPSATATPEGPVASEGETAKEGAAIGDAASEDGGNKAGASGSSNTTVANAEALGDASALDATIADDEVCAIKVTGKGDYYGDYGVFIEVQNKTDAQIFVDDNDAFTVSGTPAEAFFSLTVEAGETGSEVLWFKSADLAAAGVNELNDVKGQLNVKTKAGDIIATYDFAV